MLETALITIAISLLTAAAVVFLVEWETRIRVTRLELQLAEYERQLTREVKQRAAAASVAQRRLNLNLVDQALVTKALGHQGTIEDDVDPPWWDQLVKK